MAETKIFVVTSKTHLEEFSERALNDVIPKYRDSIIVLTEEAFDIGNVTEAAKRISDNIDYSNANEESYLLILDDTKADHGKIKSRWQSAGKDPERLYLGGPRRVHEKLKKTLNQLGFHWRAYAQSQLDLFDGKTTPLDRWCDQFFDLDVGYLGRRLAMQLQVFDYGDENGPFALRLHETLGQKLLHCYIDDGDHGGSWISVQDHLSHDLQAESLQPINVKSGAFDIPDGDMDEVVVYEDGLWSGSETVKRLKLIKESGSKVPIRFKFAVVTDFGLMVARQAIRHFELQNVVRIDANYSKLERFLKAPVPKELIYGQGMEPKTYFKALHEHVEMSAFRNSQDWPESLDRAREAAKDLGSQLVKHWYRTERPGDDADDGADKFCLGGGSFASTITFRRSVPKVCLPLFWLAGPITLNGRSTEWKPLFLDARRVEPELLLSD